MKQFDVKAEKELGGNKFYIRPFPAMKAAGISADVSAFILPIIGAVAPLVGDTLKSSEVDLGKVDSEAAARTLANALPDVSGDRVESLLKKLLTKHQNIAVEVDGGDAEKLNEDLANEIFCGEVQNMFILAVEVIKVNYSGFFKNLGDRFGGVIGNLMAKV
jgi:hypothetical protein